MRKTTLPVEWETVVLLYLQYCMVEGTVFETYQLQDWCQQQLFSALLTQLIMMLNYTVNKVLNQQPDSTNIRT